MSFTRNDKNGSAHLILDGPMTIQNAGTLMKELMECVENYKGVVIDMKAVSECDITAMQLLWSARMAAANAGKSFKIKRLPKASKAAFDRAGINQDLLAKIKKSAGK